MLGLAEYNTGVAQFSWSLGSSVPVSIVTLEAVGEDEVVRVFRILPADSLECLVEKARMVPDVLH